MRNNEFMLIEQELTLNSLEILFNKDKLSLPKTAYSHDLYATYKRNPNFFIYRFVNELADDLYIWELHPTDESLPRTLFKETEITIEEHAPIFTKIVESAIVQFFRNNQRQIFWNRYSSTWEVKLQREEQMTFGALSLHPTLVFSLRNLYSKLNGEQIIALTLRRRMKPIFTGSEETIKNQLADIRGFTRNDRDKIVASADNRDRYLEATGQKRNYENYLEKMKSSHSEFEFLTEYAENFNKIASRFHLSDGLKISKFLLVNLPNASFESLQISKPKYFYYNERTKTGYYDKVVADLKPYSFDLFRNRKLNVLVVSPDEYEGSTGEYIVKLDKKLRDLFHLRDIRFHPQTVKSQETYLEILNKIDANDYNLAIIVVSDRDKELPTLESPYYLTKAKLLNQRLPTQELTIEVIRKRNKFIDNNVALNVYSKLGGIAWTIEKSEKNISELIIGIGSTVDDSEERIIGFASVFDYNGTYLVGDCSQLSTMNEYAKNLEDYLIDVLTQAFHQKGLSEGDRSTYISFI